MRTCAKCLAAFPPTVEFFKPNKDCAGGITKTCRPCSAAYHRTWKAANTERLRPRRRELYATRYADVQNEKRRAFEVARPYQARAETMRGGMLERSRKLGLEFDASALTVQWLVRRLHEQPDCPCCGEALDVSFKQDRRKNDRSPTIDRLRPGRGYTVENVAIICWRCNNLKRDASAAELRRIADWMALMGLE